MPEPLTFLGDVFLPEPFCSLVELKNYIPNFEYPVTKSKKAYPGKINLKADVESENDTSKTVENFFRYT